MYYDDIQTKTIKFKDAVNMLANIQYSLKFHVERLISELDAMLSVSDGRTNTVYYRKSFAV